MTGEEAWKLLAPMLMPPPYHPDSPVSDTWVEAYVIMNIGTTLFDNWVANGKPREWQEKPKTKRGSNK